MQPRRQAVAAALLVLAALGSPAVVGTSSAATVPPVPTGPDVASYQHPNGSCISWRTVAAGNSTTPPRQFAFVKATDGAGYTNPYFRSCGGSAAAGDWAATRSAGLIRGAYHFARPALPVTTAVTQAQYYANVVGTLRETGDLPPVLDLESSGGLTPGQLVTWTQQWVATARALTGRTPIIYTYPYFWQTAMQSSAAFPGARLWIASYNGAAAPTVPAGWSSWTTWQYSDSVPQPGISSGPVDMSRFNGDLTALRVLADGTRPDVQTLTVPAAPVGVRATPGVGSATVQWVPGSNGGSLVSSWVVTASSGARVTVPGTATTASFTGLRNGTSYSFTVHAINSVGAGAESPASAPVVPAVPTDVFSSLTATIVDYGKATTMRATLVRTDTSAPLPGRTLSVWTRPTGSTTFTHVGNAVTDTTGTARWALTPTRATDVMMRWTAPVGWQSQQTYTRTVQVRPVVRAALSATTVLAGHTVVLSGQVVPGLGGRTVYRQGWYNGGWHTWASAVLPSTGLFRFAVTPTVRTTDVYRVLVPASPGLLAAASPTLSLTVR